MGKSWKRNQEHTAPQYRVVSRSNRDGITGVTPGMSEQEARDLADLLTEANPEVEPD